MTIFSVAAIALFSTLLALVLKKQSSPAAFVLSICTAAVIVLYAAQSVFSITDKLGSFSAMAEYIIIPVKALGITILAKFTSSLCEDAGEKSIAFAVQLFAKISVVLLALPLFEKLIDILRDIMEISNG